MDYFILILSAVITFETGLLITILWQFVSTVKNLNDSVKRIESNLNENKVTCQFTHKDVEKDLLRHEAELQRHSSIISDHDLRLASL